MDVDDVSQIQSRRTMKKLSTEIAALKARNEYLETEKATLIDRRSGKRVDVTRTRYEAEYQTIKKLRELGFKTTLLGVSRAGYYKWLKRKSTKSEKRLKHLIRLIQNVYDEHKGIYCYRRITIY